MKHRSTCPCSEHHQPFERPLAQAALIASLSIVAVIIAACALAWLAGGR